MEAITLRSGKVKKATPSQQGIPIESILRITFMISKVMSGFILYNQGIFIKERNKRD